MRILTWNVNGIKTLLQYSPWNELKPKNHESIMEELNSDIICIQETKITRAQMDKSLACMNNWDGFYSFYRRNPPKGIHGTAIFTKKSTCTPLKAEEGLSSALIPSNVISQERIGGYPSCVEADLEFSAMKDLDSEGRTTICDFGMFVLINLYCPNLTNEERIPFKNNFNKMVDQRTRELIKLGREVIVLGDLNIALSAIDSAEPTKRAEAEQAEDFVESTPREWLKEFVGPGGPMIDICREFHKERPNMYTCWETKIDARTSNYGARIDYILITPGLRPWVKDSNILPLVVGSDHCPVYVDFYEELEIEGKGLVKLWDLMNPTRSKLFLEGEGGEEMSPPGFAARFYDEFSGKQKLLSNFFVKSDSKIGSSSSNSIELTKASGINSVASTSTLAATSSASTSTSTSTSTSQPKPPTVKSTASLAISTLALRSSLFADYVSTSSPPINESTSSSSTSKGGKGKGKAKAKEGSNSTSESQMISNFFKPPPPPSSSSSSASADSSSKKKKQGIKNTQSNGSSSTGSYTVVLVPPRRSPSLPFASSQTFTETITITDDDDDDDDEGGRDQGEVEGREIEEEEEGEEFMNGLNPDDLEASYSSSSAEPSSSSSFNFNSNSASSWSNMFAPKPIPNCIDHEEPAKTWTVNKSGINKGRKFYLCNRPVGPGYDKGQKGPINPLYRCNFFEWDTIVKRPASLTPGGQNKKQKKR